MAMDSTELCYDCEAVWGVARPQGVEESRMAGPGETLGSPWISDAEAVRFLALLLPLPS
jgi:hypothetical protein